MEIYPDYIFGASQPQLYQWIKESHPALYHKVKQRVKEGRFEAQGCMWVEADTNLIGGESMVRQILFGKRFFREEFGIDIRHLWLPDAFGYSGALPQILRKSGVDYFVTQKMSWNSINRFPLHSFQWQGIDGSRVLAHMLPEATYSSPALPWAVRKIEKEYAQAGVSNRAMMLFGIGDGGGGPGEEHLERMMRVQRIPSLPIVKQERAAEFFEKWARDGQWFPVWVSELYLERHQGTFTSASRNKRWNRRIEQALHNCELLASLAMATGGSRYPALDAIWREVLLYQFHDILPGSSIKRVYDESCARYAIMSDNLAAETRKALKSIARRIDTARMTRPAIFFNTLSWPRSHWIKGKRGWRSITVPAVGYAAVDSADGAGGHFDISATSDSLENDCVKVRFDRDGSLKSFYDKQAGREILTGRGNRLAAYRDDGDAWDFPANYADLAPRYFALISSRARTEGPRAIVTQRYELGYSKLTQEIVLTAGSKRLEFRTIANWLERQSMLRTSFPVSVQSTDATYEIQFGHVKRPTHRNTSWDLAKDEVPAHKWADLSQRDYGVALINDCKYGHKIKGNVMDLCLLRSAPYPGPRHVQDNEVKPGQPHHAHTDQGKQVFAYALFPHEGDHVAGGVIREAYEFNYPALVIDEKPHKGRLPIQHGFVTIDNKAVCIETVKKAEDSGDLIVRLYESTGASVSCALRFGLSVAAVAETDLMEENPKAIPLGDAAVRLSFGPFEIKTLRIKTASKMQ